MSQVHCGAGKTVFKGIPCNLCDHTVAIINKMLPKTKSSTENCTFVIDNQSIDLDEKLTGLNPRYLVVWVKLQAKFPILFVHF